MKSVSQDHVPAIFRVEELKGVELYEITIDELQKCFKDGSLTSVDYVKYCLERIQRVDPFLEAVIETNPDALQIASDLDRERQDGHVRGPLHGIPVLVKDNMATKDKMQTTAGSWALLGSVVPRDAHVVSLLRKSGAVIIGHANMSEWSSMKAKSYSTGYSPRRGQTRNAFDLSRTPFGSSGGSAVAVSANIVPISLGTETDTSIIGPAAISGVVGIKPTVCLTSRSGVIPISENFDTVGAFGRNVSDACYALDAIVGVDHRDPFTTTQPKASGKGFASFLSIKTCLTGARFGLPIRGCWDSVPQDIKDTALKVLAAIRKAGAQVIDTNFPCASERIPPGGEWDWEYGRATESEFTIVKVDAYNGINSYLSECSGTDIKSLEDVVAYNEANRGTEGAFPGDHPAFPTGQDNFHECVKTQGLKDDTYFAALEYVQRKSRAEGIDAALQESVDGKTEEFSALLLFDRKGAGQQMAAQAGYPIVTIPIGLDNKGLPVGLSLQHTAWREAVLIKWASAIEDLLRDEFGWRATPGYKNFMAKNIPILPA
ncbi:amidase [Tothia fuscella]|uniref:Amidase n=1 Tax=Tothia fuscella TaxID=1048955 RepID=A0A9P4U4R3_9PEZI|nr:amidase [Tothia fuscella]